MTNFQLLTSSLAALALFAFPAGARGQARILANVEAGTEAGLGYKIPHIAVAIELEKPIETRWEAQGRISWSPDRKYTVGGDNELQAAGSVLWWPIQKLALIGTASYAHQWNAQFVKNNWWPGAGVVLRDRWYGSPGRVYLEYTFPTGCQWGAACVIQSNRTHGFSGYQEFRLWPHWRIGLRGAWWQFADQSNPLDRAVGRTWHNTGTAVMVVRYEFRAGSLNEKY